MCVTRVSEEEHIENKKSHSRTIRISMFTGSFAGLVLGSYFVGLDQVQSPIFPKLFFLQLSGFVFGVIYLSLRRKSVASVKSYFVLLLLIGVGYQVGQMLFPFASDRTSLVVANIIVTLYPAITIGMAKIVNHEKTNQVQHLGFLFAFLGIFLVSIGATI